MERQEKKPISASRDVLNAKGERVCRSKTMLDSEETEIDSELKGRRMLGLVFEKEGGETIDLFERLKTELPDDLDIYVVAAGNEHAYEYDFERKRAVVPMPETPKQIGMLLHELGHAAQSLESLYQDTGARSAGPGDLLRSDWRERIERMKTFLTEEEAALLEKTGERMQPLRELLESQRNGEKELASNRMRINERLSTHVQQTASKEDVLDIVKTFLDQREKEEAFFTLIDALKKRNIRMLFTVDPDNADDFEEVVLKDIKRIYRDPAGMSRMRLRGAEAILSGAYTTWIIPVPEEAEELERQMEKQRELERASAQAEKERNALKERMQTEYGEEFIRSVELLNKPRNLAERDATRRAFQWMRSLKKEGLDFLGKIQAPESLPEAGSYCGNTWKTHEGDAYTSLKWALGSYDALSPLKKPEKKSTNPFQVPSAGARD